MSYDLEIWSIKQADLTDLLTKYKFKRLGDSFYYEANDWQIVINAQQEVLDEDIPQQYMSILPGIKFLMEINLEPIGAPKKAVTFTKKISNQIAKLVSGIIIDHQEDTIITPKGIKRFIQKEKLPKFDIVEMSWWMNHDMIKTADNLQKFIDIIEVYLPEALPRRYGLTEPPQNKYKSKEEFINFLLENVNDSIVWYPNYPVMSLNLGIPSKVGPTNLGYIFCYFSVGLDSNVLKSNGWPLAVKRFFKEISISMKPFYGEIRILHNYLRGRGTCWHDSQTEDHPIKSWWWNGIPKKMGLAMVLGDPLLQYWTDFKKISAKYSDINIVDNFRNNIFNELSEKELQIPKDLIQPDKDSKYPKLWPFGNPYKKE